MVMTTMHLLWFVVHFVRHPAAQRLVYEFAMLLSMYLDVLEGNRLSLIKFHNVIHVAESKQFKLIIYPEFHRQVLKLQHLRPTNIVFSRDLMLPIFRCAHLSLDHMSRLAQLLDPLPHEISKCKKNC